MSSRLSLLALIFTLFALANAQFQFFNEMFGNQHQHHQQQASGGPQWAMHAESLSCSDYLCPDSLVCVKRPIDCPCPVVQDVKCSARHAGAWERHTICVRGGADCAQVKSKRTSLHITKPMYALSADFCRDEPFSNYSIIA
ncbi:hypothetical protein EI94DRAFT_1916127 [Lactarius quietus]|nr:hypothetical protein EI94DRAFT_1916127 [Lactarius quietus]